MKRLYSAKFITYALLLVFVVGGAVLWQRASDSQQAEIDAQTESTFVSANGEFSVTIPKSWSISERSTEEEGVLFLELFGPRNNVINAAFAQTEGVESDSVEEAISSERLNELLATPIGKDYALLQFEIISGAVYELPDSKEKWREDIQSNNTTASGIGLGEFSDFSIPTASGWQYETRLFEGSGEILTANYYLLGDLAEGEIVLYPSDSSFKQEAEDIIRSLRFTTNEEIIEQFES